jgi:hypothetical protein
MKLRASGYLTGCQYGGWQWTYSDGRKATVGLAGGKDAITLSYRVQVNGQDWQSVEQKVPVRWTPCRFGGERPLVRLRRELQWGLLRPPSRKTVRGRQVVRLPPLLSARLRSSARRTNGPRPPQSRTPAPQARC